MLNRILILSASAGAGHLRAADALEKAVKVLGAAKEVQHIDVLKYTNKAFRTLYSKAYIELVNKAPDVLGWLYDHSDIPGKHDRLRLEFDKLSMGPIIKMLKEQQPDLLLCTHFLPAEIISWLRSKGEVRSRLGVIVTDFDVHAMWLTQNYDKYYVALDETKVHLEALGMPDHKVLVTGIPIDPLFAETKDKRDMRRKHGLDPDCTTILVSAGGFGVGPIEHLVTSLLRMKSKVQVVAVCGRSAELKDRLEKMLASAHSDSVVVKPIGFTTDMDELMSAADLLIGKPGGLTTSEALAKGLAFVIVNPIPGQEERNSDHLLEQGAAIRCNNLPALPWKIDKLLSDPTRLKTMQDNSIRLSNPRAAFRVVSDGVSNQLLA